MKTRSRINTFFAIPALAAAALLIFSPPFAVYAQTPVQVSLAAPASVPMNSDFTVSVNIGQVTLFDAASYKVVYNSEKLRLDNVADGLIGSKTVPVSIWNDSPIGNCIVVENVPGLAGATGTGYLAVLHFHVIAATGGTTTISLSDMALSDIQVHSIPAAWSGAAITMNPGPLDHLGVNPIKAFLPLSGTKQFSATSYDQYNNQISGLSYDWSVVSGGGINGSGLFTAGDTAGTFLNTVQAQASQDGNTRQATATVVIGYTLTATAALQGGSRPQAGMDIPLTIKLYDQATTLDSSNILSATPLHTFTRTEEAIDITDTNITTKTITFQAVGLPLGTFNIALCSPHCLTNLKNGAELTAQGTSLNMGTLLDGNADESVQVSGADFSLLLNDYLQATGGDAWNNGRCDFDCDGVVDSVDFSIMTLNYNMTSPQVIP